MYEMVDDEKKPEIRKSVANEMKKWKIDSSGFEEKRKSIGTTLKESLSDNSSDLICGLLEIIFGSAVVPLAKPVGEIIISLIKSQKRENK